VPNSTCAKREVAATLFVWAGGEGSATISSASERASEWREERGACVRRDGSCVTNWPPDWLPVEVNAHEPRVRGLAPEARLSWEGGV
jgi:hypothetical protein